MTEAHTQVLLVGTRVLSHWPIPPSEQSQMLSWCYWTNIRPRLQYYDRWQYLIKLLLEGPLVSVAPIRGVLESTVFSFVSSVTLFCVGNPTDTAPARQEQRLLKIKKTPQDVSNFV